MDTNTSRYWTICIIANPFDKDGKPTSCYTHRQLALAKEFFHGEFLELSNQKSLSQAENKYIQAHLWRTFHHNTIDRKKRALAGLCLRCYLSHTIIKSCKIIAGRFPKNYTLFAELLSYVLNDDGNYLIILSNNQTQLIGNENGYTQPVPKSVKFLSIDILRTYNPNLYNSKNSESLDNWCIRCTRQNKQLQTFLLEIGVWTPSDWSLLCREIPQSLNSHFTNNQIQLIEVFHAVYRRDRRKLRQRGRCLEPTSKQLKEMLDLLQNRNIILSSAHELLQDLQSIAQILYQDIYAHKIGSPKSDSIDNYSQGNSDYFSQRNVSSINKKFHSEDIEEIEIRELLNQLPNQLLFYAISEIIPQRVTFLSQKKSYSAYAPKFILGLQLYYQKNNPLSLKEIAALWQINWAKARRIFQLRQLIENVQSSSEKSFIKQIQAKASKFFTCEISCKPNNLRNIAQEVRNFLYEIAFKEAYAEIVASRSLNKNSLFAQILRDYISKNKNVA